MDPASECVEPGYEIMVSQSDLIAMSVDIRLPSDATRSDEDMPLPWHFGDHVTSDRRVFGSSELRDHYPQGVIDKAVELIRAKYRLHISGARLRLMLEHEYIMVADECPRDGFKVRGCGVRGDGQSITIAPIEEMPRINVYPMYICTKCAQKPATFLPMSSEFMMPLFNPEKTVAFYTIEHGRIFFNTVHTICIHQESPDYHHMKKALQAVKTFHAHFGQWGSRIAPLIPTPRLSDNQSNAILKRNLPSNWRKIRWKGKEYVMRCTRYHAFNYYKVLNSKYEVTWRREQTHCRQCDMFFYMKPSETACEVDYCGVVTIRLLDDQPHTGFERVGETDMLKSIVEYEQWGIPFEEAMSFTMPLKFYVDLRKVAYLTRTLLSKNADFDFVNWYSNRPSHSLLCLQNYGPPRLKELATDAIRKYLETSNQRNFEQFAQRVLNLLSPDSNMRQTRFIQSFIPTGAPMFKIEPMWYLALPRPMSGYYTLELEGEFPDVYIRMMRHVTRNLFTDGFVADLNDIPRVVNRNIALAHNPIKLILDMWVGGDLPQYWWTVNSLYDFLSVYVTPIYIGYYPLVGNDNLLTFGEATENLRALHSCQGRSVREIEWGVEQRMWMDNIRPHRTSGFCFNHEGSGYTDVVGQAWPFQMNHTLDPNVMGTLQQLISTTEQFGNQIQFVVSQLQGTVDNIMKRFGSACLIMIVAYMDACGSDHPVRTFLRDIGLMALVWNQFFRKNENDVVGQGQSDEDIDPVTCLGFIAKMIFKCNDISWLTAHSNTIRTVMFAQSVFRNLRSDIWGAIEFVRSIVERLYQWYTGLPVDAPEDVLQDIRDLYEFQTEFLKVVSNVTTDSMTMVKYHQIRNLILQAHLICKKYTNVVPRRVLEDFNHPVRMASEMLAQFDTLTQQAALRVQPPCVVFCGRTGQGKSTLIPVLSTDVLEKLGQLPGAAAAAFYRPNKNRNNFYDGYVGQPVFWADEWLSTSDDEMALQDVQMLFDLVNVAPLPLNMAEIENKGKTYFTSQFFFATTNRDVWNWEKLGARNAIGAEACRRRISMILEVELDRNKINGPLDVTAWKFHKLDQRGTSAMHTGETLTYHQLVAEIVNLYKQGVRVRDKINDYVNSKYVDQVGQSPELVAQRLLSQMGPIQAQSAYSKPFERVLNAISQYMNSNHVLRDVALFGGFLSAAFVILRLVSSFWRHKKEDQALVQSVVGREKTLHLNSMPTGQNKKLVLNDRMTSRVEAAQSQIDWVKKVIKTNLYTVIADRANGISRSHCFFLNDRTFVMNRHMVNNVKTMSLSGNSKQLTFDMNTVKVAHDSNNDLVFITLGKPVPDVKNIQTHTRPFAAYLKYYAKVIRAGSVFRGGDIQYCGEATRHNNITAQYQGEGYSLVDFMQVKDFKSEPGDCGLPYFAITSNSAIFLGIHDAYSLSTNTSFFVPVFKQDCGELQMAVDFQNFDWENVSVEDSIFVARKSKIYPTELYDAVVERCGSLKRIPAALRSVDGVDPFAKAIAAFDVPDKRDDSLQKYLVAALEYVATKHQLPRPVEPLTSYDAAWGVGLDDSWYVSHASKINLNTAAGYTWRKIDGRGKRKLLNEDGLDYIPAVYEKVDELENRWKQGKSGQLCAVDAMKDELRPVEKVKECKTRIISVMPVEFTIVVRKYTLPFTTWLMSHCTTWESAIGINPHGVDWRQLYNRLAKYPHWIAGDYSGFDRTIPTQIGDLFADYLLKTNPALNQHETLIRQLVYDMQHMTHLAGNLKYQPTHGNPSGQPLTACFNSFVNQMVVIGAFLWVGRDLGWTEATYEKNVEVTVFGDDNIITVSDEVFPHFNFLTIKEFAEKLGMRYTDSLKTGVVRKETPFSEVTYLKRQFRVDKPYVFAPLDEAVVEEMPAYAKTSAYADLDMVYVKSYNSLVEKFHYGPQPFNEWKSWLNACLVKHNHNPITLSYETVLNSFVNNMITYDGEEDEGGQLRVYQRDLVIYEAEKRVPYILDDYYIDDSPVSVEFPFAANVTYSQRLQKEDTFLQEFVMKDAEKNPQGQGGPAYLGTAMSDTNNLNNLTEQTIEPPSTVENVTTSQDLAAFQEVAIREPDEGQSPPESVPAQTIVPYPASDYITQLERYFQVGEFLWTTEQGINTKLWDGMFPGDLLKHPMFIDRLSYYHYIRGELEIDVRLTANAFQYGALQLQAITCAPSLTTIDGDVLAGRDRMLNVVQGSQNLHVDISAMQNTTVKLIIPWEFPFDYIDLLQIYTQQGGSTLLTNQGKLHKAGMGEARILVLAPLSTPQKDPVNSVTVTVWARFKNLIVAQPCGTRWIGMRTESDVVGQGQDIQPALARCKLNIGNVIKNIGSGILNVGKTLGNALLKGATGALEKSAGALVNFGIGTLLGGSKPHSIFAQKPITLAPHVDLPTISGNNPCNALSLMEDCSVAMDSTLMNVDSGDFADLAAIECLQAIATVPVALKSNTCVMALPVCPIPSEYESPTGIGSTVMNRFWTANLADAWKARVYGSYAAYYANQVASYWRGDVTFRVHFYASQLHQARFTLVWSSTPLLDLTTLPDIYGTMITKQVVLENGEADVEFQVKYSRAQPYLPTISAGYHDKEVLLGTMMGFEHTLPSTTSVLSTIPYSNGWFYIYLTNAITPFQDGVTAPVRIYVYEKWDNFVLQQPRLENPLQDVTAQGQVEGDVGVSVQKKLFQHFGDQMTDVPTLLHRPELMHVTLRTSSPLPLPLPWEPLVQDVNVSNVQVSPSVAHLLSGNNAVTNLRALMLPWRFARGSSCYRIVPSARVNQAEAEPTGWLVTLGATSSGNYGPFHPIGAINGASQSFGALWTRNDYYPSLEFTVPWYSHVNFGFIWNRSFMMSAMKAQLTNDELWVADHVRAWLSWPNAEPESIQIVPIVMSTGDDFQLGGRTALPEWTTIAFAGKGGIGTGFNVAWVGTIAP